MEILTQGAKMKSADWLLDKEAEVKPKLKRMLPQVDFSRRGKCFCMIILIIVVCASGLSAQQYKFKWCINYDVPMADGSVVTNAVSYGEEGDSIIVNISNDSIKFNTDAISLTGQTTFLIEKCEEFVNEHGNKLIDIIISIISEKLEIDKDGNGHMVIDSTAERIKVRVLISGNSLTASFNQ